MILICPECATRYIVPDSAIGANGRQVRCAACKHSWYQPGPELEMRPASPEPKADLTAAVDSSPVPAPAVGQDEVTAAAEPERPNATATIEEVAEDAGFDVVDDPAPVDMPESPVADPAGEVGDFSVDRIFDRSQASADGADSAFAPEVPFRPRRNPAKLWTMAASAFALLVVVAGGALWYFGPPAWAVRSGILADTSEPDLLFYLAKPAERRKLPNGSEYFAFSARIVNSGDSVQSVPPVLVELRDRQNRVVFQWTTKADKAELKPGQEASINESRLDIPKNAENLSLAFVNRGH